MAYKRYIKRGGKLYGPYVYHSKKTEGRVTSEYRGKISSDRNLIFLIMGLSLLFLLIFVSTFDIRDSSLAFTKNIVGLTVEDEQDQKSVKFDIKIIDFDSPAKLGEFFDFTYFVKGVAEINSDVEIDFWIEVNGEVITSGKDVIFLGSFEEKTETTKLFLPSNVESGVYEFYIRVTHPSYSAESYRTIEIQVDEGFVKIIPIELKVLQIFAVIVLIILALIILFLIFYLERKKIKAGLILEERWVKKHKISVLAFSLFVVLGILAYSLNLINILISWIKTPFFSYALKIILAVFVFLIAIFIAGKMNLFERFKIWRTKRRGIRLFKEQKRRRLKLLRSKAKPKRIKLIKAKPKTLTIRPLRYGRQFRKAFFNLVNIFIILIKNIFRISSKLGEKVFDNLKIFSRRIKKKSRLIFDESKNLKKTLVHFVKFNLSSIFKLIKSEKKPRKLRKHKLEKFVKKKVRLKLKIWSKIKFKLDAIKIPRLWNVEKLPEHLIPKETQKEIREISSIKSLPLWNLKKSGLKSIELIQGIIYKSSKSINNSVKSLGIFLSAKSKGIGGEGRKAVRKTERTIEEIYEEVFHLLRGIFGKKSYKDMIKDFQKILVKGRNFTKKHLKILKSLEETAIREFKLTEFRTRRNVGNLEETARREFKLTKFRIHRNIDNLRGEAEVLIKKLGNYSRSLDRKELEKIRKTVSLSKGRSTRLINKIQYNLKNSSIAIHDYLIKMQVSYLRGLYNIKMVFFKEKSELINLIKDLENRELVRMKEEEDEKVRKILEQKKEENRRKFFEKKVFKDKLEEPKVKIIPKEEPEKQEQPEDKLEEPKPKIEIIPKEEPDKQEKSMGNIENKSAEDIIEDIARKEKEKGEKL